MGWLASIVKTIISVVLVVLLVCIAIPIIKTLVIRSISPTPQVSCAEVGPVPEWNLEDPPTGEETEAVEEEEDRPTSGEDSENVTSV